VSTTLNTTTRLERATAGWPSFVFDPSFEECEAEDIYDVSDDTEETIRDVGYMIDDVTRATTKKMHYAAWRWRNASRPVGVRYWRERYYHFRDLVVLGNRKLVFRAVSRWQGGGSAADDMIGDCHIVLIQAVAAYNPWIGIRFSTYAFTCLMRALSRISQRQSVDWLSRSLPLEALPHGEPRDGTVDSPAASGLMQLDEFLTENHSLLSPREKTVIRRRFCLNEPGRGGTLEQVGKELGLSKERVRQVQATALDKLRKALMGGSPLH
jgi:RNA polymerase sigma factor (sigma-70 family)